MKKLLSILMLLVGFSMGVWADEISVNTKTGSGGTGTWSASSGSVTGSVNVTGAGTISFSLPKVSDNNAVGSGYLTWKKNSVMTITMPEGYSISEVQFTFSSQDKGPGNSSKNEGDASKNMSCSLGTVAAVGSSVTVFAASGTPAGVVTATNTMGSEFRLTNITLTYSAAGFSIKTQPQSAEYSIGATATALTVVAQNGEEPYTYQWYSCDDAEKNNPQPVGDKSASYTPSTASVGTFYYYCKVTDIALPTPAEVESNVATITVNPKSNACKLYEAKYSNGFNAFINEEAKTVTVYYMAGEDAPTVTGTPDVSADATYDVSDPTKIVVTAEDGTTTATYAVTRTPVTPYNGDGVEFDGTETWIKTGNAYLTTTGTGDKVKTYYAWVINRQLKDSENRDNDARVALGKTRIYFFVDGAHSIRLYNEKGSSLSFDRKIKVYVNGELQESPTSMGAYDKDEHPSPSITITTGNVPAMVEISSDQNSGDTGWGRIEVIKNKAVEVTDAKWATTTTPNWPVSFDENATVYVVASAEGSIKLTQISDAPANTPIIVNAAAGSYTMTPKASAAAIATNLLTSATGTETGNGAGNYYVLGITSKGVGFGKLADGVKLAKGKAYIDGSEFDDAKDFYPFVIGDEESETTSINSIENGEWRIENYDYFNLSGQRVGKDYKGIVIVNGKKVIRK